MVESVEFQYLNVIFDGVEVFMCVDTQGGRIWDWEIVNFDAKSKECMEIVAMLIDEEEDMPRLQKE